MREISETDNGPTSKLGRLQKVDLRKVWISEASDFTPWLASEENIAELGKAIGMEELEVEAREQNVGPFKADILCKDGLGHWVLIENQLEKTDHTHLGQLLTYAAGLKAVTIVWIAQHFTEEHRAALDWLNNITDEEISFFGVEIELWQIGSSEIAPKFNLVSKPNDWGKRVTDAAQRMSSDNLSAAKQLQLEYWTEFADYIKSHSKIIKATKPLAQHWMNIFIGTSGSHLNALVNTREQRITVQLLLTQNAKQNFYALENERQSIEQTIGCPVEWRELPEGKQSYVELSKDADPYDRDSWPSQQQWLCQTLESFYKAFSPRLKEIRRSPATSTL